MKEKSDFEPRDTCQPPVKTYSERDVESSYVTCAMLQG